MSLAHEEGVVAVEYAVVLATVSVGCIVAVSALGVPLVSLFRFQSACLGLPVP